MRIAVNRFAHLSFREGIPLYFIGSIGAFFFEFFRSLLAVIAGMDTVLSENLFWSIRVIRFKMSLVSATLIKGMTSCL